MKNLIKSAVLILLMSLSLSAQEASSPRIQVALLLDTSSSMDGLINQAKSQLWKIVNELSLAEKDSKTPILEVSLFEYGKSSISRGEGYMRMVASFTNDLDKLSAELFSLTTNGGDEYCGLVIDRAVENLNWHRDDGNIKIIFIAGNESFTQGDHQYEKAIAAARDKGIVVNTIFCGNHESGISLKWKAGAILGNGTYMNIDHNNRPQVINAPQDAVIYRLGQELNKTYVPYGYAGNKRKEAQEIQDVNAKKMSASVAIERSIAKASKHYSNSGWDLVDAFKNGKIKISDLKKKDLPIVMKKMTQNEQIKYIQKMEKRRSEVQAKINSLNKKRRLYIAEKRKSMTQEQSLDSVMIKSIKNEALRKNFKFK